MQLVRSGWFKINCKENVVSEINYCYTVNENYGKLWIMANEIREKDREPIRLIIWFLCNNGSSLCVQPTVFNRLEKKEVSQLDCIRFFFIRTQKGNFLSYHFNHVRQMSQVVVTSYSSASINSLPSSNVYF